ncbi:MAG: preprotein translocase subunit SecG [Dysgonomonas sp.]
MYILLTVLIVIAALLLILVVLVQNSKGGGLASMFSSSNNIMGVQKTTDTIEKATWGLAAVIVVLSLASAKLVIDGSNASSNIKTDIVAPAAAPASGQPAPNVNTPAAPQGNQPADAK